MIHSRDFLLGARFQPLRGIILYGSSKHETASRMRSPFRTSDAPLESQNETLHSDSERTLNVLRKINETYQLMHLRANDIVNYVTIDGKNFYSYLEFSYVLRSKYKFIENYDVNLSLEIDMPCISSLPEIELGHWNGKMSEINERVTHTSTFRY